MSSMEGELVAPTHSPLSVMDQYCQVYTLQLQFAGGVQSDTMCVLYIAYSEVLLSV